MVVMSGWATGCTIPDGRKIGRLGRPAAAIDADVLINMPVAKSHGRA